MTANIDNNNIFKPAVASVPENISSLTDKTRDGKIQQRIQRAAAVTKEQFTTLDGARTISQVADTSVKVSEAFQDSGELAKNIRQVASELRSSLNLLTTPVNLVNYGHDTYRVLPQMFSSSVTLTDRLSGLDTIFFGAASLVPSISSLLKFLSIDNHKFLAIPFNILRGFSVASAYCLVISSIRRLFSTILSMASKDCTLTDSPKVNKRIYRVLTFHFCRLLREMCVLSTGSLLLLASFCVTVPLAVSLAISVISLVLLIGLKYYQGILDPEKSYLKV